MRFNKICKVLKFGNPQYVSVQFSELSAQYNSDRYRFYSQVAKSLAVCNMPHVDFLKQFALNVDWEKMKGHNYAKMHQLYGRKLPWIKNKMEQFIKLNDWIKGLTENNEAVRITVLREPIVKNNFNSGYEIYEGHHRVAACFAAKWELMPVCLVTPNHGSN